MEWIKVNDRFPTNESPVLVTILEKDGEKRVFGNAVYAQTCCGGREWCCEYGAGLNNDEKVTHWMPYPEPAED